jgi:hypothetical protein
VNLEEESCQPKLKCAEPWFMTTSIGSEFFFKLQRRPTRVYSLRFDRELFDRLSYNLVVVCCRSGPNDKIFSVGFNGFGATAYARQSIAEPLPG